jgi:hypothetical protein
MGDAQQPQQQQPALEPAAKPAAAVPDGPSLAPTYQQVLSLQRSAGNAAVARALADRRAPEIGVKASDQLWYFNGEQQAGHPNQIKMSADAHTVGRFVWDVVDGHDRVELGGSGGPSHAESQTDNGVNVLSRSGSKGDDDVRVRVSHYGHDGELLGVGEDNLGVRTPAGTVKAGTTTSTPTSEPVGDEGPAQGTGLEDRDEAGEIAGGGAADQAGAGDLAPPADAGQAAGTPAAAPGSLRHDSTTHAVHATFAYETHENYTVLDDKGAPIKGFDVNEQWPGGVVNDAAGADWRRGPPGGSHSGGTTFFDRMQGETATHKPTPQNPQTPLGASKVQHWDQEWYIGSVTPGSGTLVQKNLFQKYRDHAAHENIKSPP